MNRRAQDGALLFGLAILVRVLIVPLSILRINPVSQEDAVGFAEAASQVAADLATLQFPATDFGRTYEIWGTYISPFWFLPGPSALYARLFLICLAAFAVYNVYCLGIRFHSRQAGVIASLPLALFPSVVMVHATVLREAFILAGLTTAARYLFASPPQFNRWVDLCISGMSVLLVVPLRPDNTPVYAIAALCYVAAGVASVRDRILERTDLILLGFVCLLAVSGPLLRAISTELALIREVRMRGRTIYLEGLYPTGIIDPIVFSWIGALYFLIAPFPWMVETLPDAIVMAEGMVTLIFTFFALWLGLRIVLAESPPAAITLGMFLTIGVIAYGFGTANYGVAMRHRQMFTWVIFLFGGIGIASRVRLCVWETNTGQSEENHHSNADSV